MTRTLERTTSTLVFGGLGVRLTRLERGTNMPPVSVTREERMARVTGIGGVFFKATSDAKKLAAWYEANLGMALEPWGGAILRWPEDNADDHGLTVWHVAQHDTGWFNPSPSSFMINYRVDDLAGVLARLKDNGVDVYKGPEAHENGKFAWVLDPDGNKVELWEPRIWNDKNKEASAQ